jgi:hypothetical protein
MVTTPNFASRPAGQPAQNAAKDKEPAEDQADHPALSMGGRGRGLQPKIAADEQPDDDEKNLGGVTHWGGI